MNSNGIGHATAQGKSLNKPLEDMNLENTKEETVVIVDTNDNIVGSAPRYEMVYL